MRILVTGAAGMLGSDVMIALGDRGHSVQGLDRSALDITDESAVADAVWDVEAVVNCAAWTAVDDAESEEAAAYWVNAIAPQLLARATHRAGAGLVHVSTDYVFSGDAAAPYDEEAPLAPRSAYGRSKAAGEWAVRAEHPRHWIVRTAWLYGAGGDCFPRTIARLAGEREQLSVVDDQIGQPTWTVDVAGQIAALLEGQAPWGTYHATSAGTASWFDFATAVVDSAGARARVAPTTTAAFSRPAPRPAWSVLGHRRWAEAGIAAIGNWRERWEAAAADVLGEAAADDQAAMSTLRRDS